MLFRSASTLYGTLHGPGYSGEFGKGKVIDTNVTLSDDYHIYAVEWIEDEIRWFFDDEMYAVTRAADIAPLEWVYNKPFYIIVNLAMGGHFTGPIDETLESATLLIDYIRHYSINGKTIDCLEESFCANAESSPSRELPVE